MAIFRHMTHFRLGSEIEICQCVQTFQNQHVQTHIDDAEHLYVICFSIGPHLVPLSTVTKRGVLIGRTAALTHT